jgi:hypothetical protein
MASSLVGETPKVKGSPRVEIICRLRGEAEASNNGRSELILIYTPIATT